jgi:hypothetical protein
MAKSDDDVLESGGADVYKVVTRAKAGRLPITEEMLRNSPSGDLFGLTQNAGMGWNPAETGRPQFLILSTQGGLRAPDGTPIALGYHTGHWEIGLLVQAAAEELRRLGANPFAGYCSDLVTAGRRAPPECSTAYRLATPPLFRRLADLAPPQRRCWGSRHATRGCRRYDGGSRADRLPCAVVPAA